MPDMLRVWRQLVLLMRFRLLYARRDLLTILCLIFDRGYTEEVVLFNLNVAV